MTNINIQNFASADYIMVGWGADEYNGIVAREAAKEMELFNRFFTGVPVPDGFLDRVTFVQMSSEGITSWMEKRD